MNKYSIKAFIYMCLFSFLIVAMVSCELENEGNLNNKADENLKPIPQSSIDVSEIFETISGDLHYEEILSNSNEFGSIWTIQLDKKRDILYALTATNLIKIDLKQKIFGSLLDSTNIAYKDMLNKAFRKNEIPIYSIPDISVNDKGEVFCVLRNNTSGDLYNIDNWLKIDPFKYKAEFVGRTYQGSIYKSFQASNKKYYSAENSDTLFSHVRVFDKDLQNSELLIPRQSNEEASAEFISSIQELPNNKIRFLYKSGFYADVINDKATTVNEITTSENLPKLSNALQYWGLGIDYSKDDYYLFYKNTSPSSYNIRRAKADITNPFEIVGAFSLKKTYEHNSRTYTWSIDKHPYTLFAVANNGDIYILIHHPYTPFAEIAPELTIGGIYKISIK